MFETVRYEVARKRRGIAVLVAGISALASFFVGLYPQMQTSEVDLDELIEAWPPAMREAFGVETIASIEGFLAVELYNFVWLLLLGLYFAYSAGSTIADDVEHHRMDLLLSFPVSRTRLLAEKFASILTTILVLNAVVAVVIYAGVLAVGESIDPVGLAMAHLLSIPYLFVCAAIGLVLSVSVDRAEVAQRVAIGLIFGLYVVESIAASAEGFDWIRYLSPTYYYDPTAILVHGTYGLLDAGILLAIFVGLSVAGRELFRRRDI